MDPERWRVVREVFDELVELEPAARTGRLATLAATDPDLRLAVKALLEADAEAEERLAGRMFSPGEAGPGQGRDDPLGLTGRTLSHFRVQGSLGSGGMGVVYAAEDTRLGRAVALKFPLSNRRLDSSAKQRFLQEARAAGTLDHPNLCSVYEVGESEDGLLFLAMPLYRGETLQARLAREGRLGIPDALAIARQIAQGLAAAHQAGIVHRDLKPGNVMLLPDGLVKVLDFGLAKARDHSLTGPGTLLGTAAYMAPEQIRDDPVDGRADLWALGVVLYEMLTGRQPFPGEREIAIAHAIVHEEPVAPSDLRPEILPALQALVLSLLQKQPGRRPPAARDVDAALSALELAPEPGRFPRRRPVVLALGLLVLVVAGGTMSRAFQPAPTAAGRPAVSPNTIVVLPFAYRGTEEFAFLGEGMVDLLSANLDGAGDIRVADPDAVLALVRQAGSDRLEPEQARKLAARLGAGSYVLGTIVETGGRIRIGARLHSADRNDGRSQAVVDGGSTQLFQLVDGLTAKLIAQRSGGPAGALPRLAALTTDSLAALKAYLEAERHFRAGHMDSTIQAAERAIRVDSSFALAHYRLATALMWHEGRGAAAAVDRALRHGHRLSGRDRRLIQAFAAFLHGRVVEADRMYREIVTRNPDDLEATYQLVSLISSWSRVVGGSWLDTRPHVERVLSMDPSRPDALFHLSWIAARERRLEQLDSLTDRLLPALAPDKQVLLRGQRAIAAGDTLETARFIATLRRTGEDAAQFAARVAVFTTGDLAVGRRVWRVFTEPSRSRGLRVLAHLTLAKMELMTGRWSAAIVELDSAAALDPATALEHRALLSLWPLLRVTRSELLALRTAVQRWKADAGPSDERFVSGAHAPAHPYLRPYLLGLLSVRLGEHAPALEHAAELERRAEGSLAPGFVRGLGRTLRVEVARARGRLDQALATLDSAGLWAGGEMTIERRNSPFYAHEYEQLIRAELLHGLGRDDEALQVYRATADYLFHGGAVAHLRLAEIYESRREPQKAAAHWARFAELWKDCDPEFRPLVEEARRRIAQ